MSLIWSTSLLTIGSLVGRCYGFVFRIILARALGAEGMGAFQMVMTFFMAVSGPFISALPITLARVLAAHHRDPIDVHRVLSTAVCLGGLGSALAIAALVLVNRIQPMEMFDHIPSSLWFWLIPSMVLSLMAQAIRGYYLGVKRVIPLVLSQHLEQLVEIGWLVLLVRLASPMGLAEKITFVVAGMTVADVAASLFLLIALRREKLAPSKRMVPGITSELLGLGLPFCFSRLLGSITRVAEASLIPLCLAGAGLSHAQALAVYGQMIGLAMPVIFFPAMIIVSLSSTLVPAVAEALHKPELLARRIRQGISMGLMVGCGAAVLFATRGAWLGVALFKDAQAGEFMALLAPAALFWYLDIVTDNLLRGLGYPIVAMVSDFLSAALRLGYLYTFAHGAGIAVIQEAILYSAMLSVAINWVAVIVLSKVVFDWYLWLVTPALAVAGMALVLSESIYALGPMAITMQMGLAVMVYTLIWFVFNLHPKRGEIFWSPRLGTWFK